MAQSVKEVKVVINGEEYVSRAAKDATDGMNGFTSKIGGWFKSFTDLKSAWDLISNAASKVKAVVVDSFAAYDALETSQRKLEGTSKLTGLSLEYLQAVAEKGRQEFGLSRVVANGFATEVAKLEKASGGAASASDLLNGFLNVGAARGMTAAQSMEAARKSILGIDEGTDALFNKNPSGLWDDYAKVIGKSVGKFDDMDKQAALAFAVIQGGTRTGGEYARFLESAQGQQGAFNMKLEESKALLGETLQPLRALTLEGLGGLMDYLAKSKDAVSGFAATLGSLVQTIGAVLSPLIGIASFFVDGLSVALEYSMLSIRGWAVNITNTVGQVLRAFGVEFGDKLVAEAMDRRFKLEGDQMDFQKRFDSIVSKWRGDQVKKAEDTNNKLLDGAKKKSDKHVAIADDESKKLKKISDDLEAKVLKMFDESKDAAIKSSTGLRDAFGDALTVSLSGAGDAIQKIRDRLVAVQNTNAPDEVARLTAKSEGYLATLRLMNDAHRVYQQLGYGLPPRDAKERLQEIVDKLTEQAFLEFQATGNAEDYRKRLDLVSDLKGKIFDLSQKGVKEDEKANKEAEKHEKTLLKMFDNVTSIARGALDMAQAFDMVDDSAASVLNSAINIGASIAKIAGGDVFAGVSGLLGGVANIVSTMMNGDAERRRLTQENNQRLAELRDEIGNLDLNVTGDDFNKVKGVLEGIVPKLTGNPIADLKSVLPALMKAGLTFGDLERVGNELGIPIKNKDGAFDLAQLPKLLEALGLTEIGQFGTDFNSRLRSTRAGFDVNQVGEVQQIQQLANVGGSFSSALAGVFDANDIAGSRGRLQALFTRLQNGGVSASELGGLTGSQFLELITDLIGRIDRLSPSTGGTGSPGTGTTPPGDVIGGPATGGEGGAPGIPQTTLTTVVDTLTQQHEKVAAYHVTSLTFMERTAMATEATAINTELALGYLEAIAKGGAGGSDEQLGRRMSLDRRLAGLSTL